MNEEISSATQVPQAQPPTQENNEINITEHNFNIPTPSPPLPIPMTPSIPMCDYTIPPSAMTAPAMNPYQIQSTFEQPKQLNPNDEIAERLLQVTNLSSLLVNSPFLRLWQVK